MKLTREDLPLIQVSLALLVVALLGFGVLYYMGDQQLKRSNKELKLAKQKLSEARNKVQRASEEREEALHFLPLYNKHQQDGWLGEEQRLDWIETLASIRDTNKFFPLTYEISARAPYAAAPKTATGNVEVLASRMKFQFPLLHEGDLFTLLRELRAAGHGNYALQSCKLVRVTGAKSMSGIEPRLTANCELDWLTLHIKEDENAAQQTPPPAAPAPAQPRNNR
jgi:hypothetical protein